MNLYLKRVLKHKTEKAFANVPMACHCRHFKGTRHAANEHSEWILWKMAI
jgi:hypothetical protein